MISTNRYKLATRREPVDPNMSSGVFNIDTGYWIYENPDCRMWKEYQRWLAEGNQPLPADDPS
jgi:hypothetical protein